MADRKIIQKINNRIIQFHMLLLTKRPEVLSNLDYRRACDFNFYRMKELVSLLSNDVLLSLQFITVLIGSMYVVYLGVKLWKDK